MRGRVAGGAGREWCDIGSRARARGVCDGRAAGSCRLLPEAQAGHGGKRWVFVGPAASHCVVRMPRVSASRSVHSVLLVVWGGNVVSASRALFDSHLCPSILAVASVCLFCEGGLCMPPLIAAAVDLFLLMVAASPTSLRGPCLSGSSTSASFLPAIDSTPSLSRRPDASAPGIRPSRRPIRPRGGLWCRDRRLQPLRRSPSRLCHGCALWLCSPREPCACCCLCPRCPPTPSRARDQEARAKANRSTGYGYSPCFGAQAVFCRGV